MSEHEPGGCRLVAVGGGHGAAQTLRAALLYADDITGVISVADDGGSSGKLREELGIPAPGDLRRCIAALAGEGSPVATALEHRFEGGELEGHAFGNLLIASLAGALGDFAAGVSETARIAGARGRVFPASDGPVVLKGTGERGEISGQVAIKQGGGVQRVSLVPPDPAAPSGAVSALRAADQIVLGPGSLFTSVLAAAIVPAVREAIARSSAERIYVANLREQAPETAGFDVGDHVQALRDHGVVVDTVLTDPGGLDLGELPDDVRLELAPLGRRAGPGHDPILLADALSRLLRSRSTLGRGDAGSRLGPAE